MLLDRFKKLFPLQVECLMHARKTGRLAHAYLLNSDNPEIRNDFSIALAQIANCQNISESGEPCGKCSICEQLISGVYPELHVLMPSSKSRIIPVGNNPNPEEDTVRWFENLFYLTSASEEGKKIGIIHDADRMQPTAQNAFLKTLEEPPSNTFFILTTGNPSQLLPTTISRCQMLVLLTNKCEYNFTGSEELFQTLKELQFDAIDNLTTAERCAGKIISLSKDLDSEAKIAVAEKWQAQLDTAREELEPAGRKRVEKRIEAAEKAEYLQLRTYFLSAIHTWFALVYQAACGNPKASAANPEILSHVTLPEKIEEKAAYKALTCAEKLMQDLNFNVNEELALRSFCLNVAMK